MTRTVLQLNLFLFAFITFFATPRQTQAIGNAKDVLPVFRDPPKTVLSSEPGQLRSVFVPDVLDLPVIQQPIDDPYYVSDRDAEATQFSMVSKYGNIGLLAHNTLSGRHFFNLEVGQEVRLMYGNGRVEYFVVKQILRFQALEPKSVTSAFRNLDRNEIITAGELFNRAYGGEHRLVFQTCIEAKRNPSWGRLFVIAVPKE